MSEKATTNSPEGTSLKGRLWNGLSLVLAGALLVAVVGSIYAFALAQQGDHEDKALPPKFASDSAKSASTEAVPPIHKVTAGENALSGKTEFGQFPPYTQAEHELEKMLRERDEDIDLALANWLIAADIPQFRDLTRDAYLTQLDAMIERVRQDMAKMQASGWHGTNPNYPETRCVRFCSAIIRLRFAYAEEFREENLTPVQMKALYADANNIFLAGLLRTRQGSCVSMPLIYLVIGQRLGMPVHLVTIGKHYLIRWDEPTYRMNIETTSVEKIAATPEDSVYLDTEGMTRDQLRGSELRNLSNREVVGELFFARMSYWHTKGGKCETQSCLDLSRARHLAPDDPRIKAVYQAVFNHYGIKSEYTSIDIRPKE